MTDEELLKALKAKQKSTKNTRDIGIAGAVISFISFVVLLVMMIAERATITRFVLLILPVLAGVLFTCLAVSANKDYEARTAEVKELERVYEEKE